MRKLFTRVIASFLVVQFPASLFAAEITTPAMYVRPLKSAAMAQDIQKVQAENLNLDRSNRNNESDIQVLIEENARLIKIVADQKQMLANLKDKMSDPTEMGFYSNREEFEKLKEVLNSYRDEITDRDRRLIEQNDQMTALRQKMSDMEKRFNQVMDLSGDVMQQKMKAGKEFWQDVDGFLAQKKEALEAQKILLQQKDEQLSTMKVELVKTKDQLKSLSNLYQKANQSARQEIAIEPNSMDSPKAMARELIAPAVLVTNPQTVPENKRDLATIDAQAKQIQQLTEDLQSAQADFVELKNSLKKTDTSIADNDAVILANDKQIMELKSQLVQAKEQIAQKNKTIEQQATTIEEQKNVIETLDGQITTMKTDVASLADAVSGTSANYEDLTKKITALNDRLQQQISALKDKDAVIYDRDATIKDLKAQFASTKMSQANIEEMVKLKGDLASMSYELENALKDNDSYETQIKALHQIIDDLRLQIVQQSLEPQPSVEQVDVSGYENELAQLKNRLESVERILNTKTETMDSLNTQLTELIKTNEMLVRQSDEWQKKLSNKEKDWAERNALTSQIMVLDQQEAQLVNERNRLLQQKGEIFVRKAQYAQDQLKKTIVYWQDNEASVNGQIEELKKQIKSAQEIAAASKQAIAQTNAQALAKEEELSRVKTLVNEQESHMQQLKDSLASSKQDISAKDQEVAQLKKDIEDKKAELARLNDMLNSYQDKFKNAASSDEQKAKDLAALQDRVSQLEAGLTQAKTDLVAKEDVVKKTKEYFAELERRYAVREQEANTASLNLSMVQSKMADQKAIYESKIKDLEGQIAALKTDLTAFQEKLTVAESRLKDTVSTAEVENLKTMLTASRSDVVELTQQVEEKGKALAQLATDREATAKDFKGQADSIANLNKQLADLKLKIQKLNADVELKDKQMARLKMQSTQKTDQINSLMKQIADSDKKIKNAVDVDNKQQLKQALADAKDQINALNEELKNRQAEIVKLSVSATPKDTSKQQGANQSAVLTEEIRVLRANLQDAQARLEDARKTANDKQRQFKDDTKDLREQVKDYQAQITELKVKMSAYQQEFENKNKIVTGNQGNVDVMHQQLSEAKEKINSLTARVTTFERMKSSQPGNEGYLIRDGKDLSMMMSRMTDEITKYEQQLSVITDENLRLKAEYKADQARYKENESQMKQAQDALKECQSKLVTYQTLYDPRRDKGLPSFLDSTK